MIRTHGLGSDTYELELTVPVPLNQSEKKDNETNDAAVEPLTELLSSTVLPLLKEAQSALARLLNTLKDLPEGNFKSRAVTRSIALQQRLTGVRGKLVECGVVQERRVEEKVVAETSQSSSKNTTNNSNNMNTPLYRARNTPRKRKSTGSDSTRPKQRRKTR